MDHQDPRIERGRLFKRARSGERTLPVEMFEVVDVEGSMLQHEAYQSANRSGGAGTSNVSGGPGGIRQTADERSAGSSSSDKRGYPRGANYGRSGSSRGESSFPDYVRSRPNQLMKKGSLGPQTEVITNYYRFEKLPEFQMSLYAIMIEPEPELDLGERVIKQLIWTKREDIGTYIVSGYQLFTTRPIVREDITTFTASVQSIPDVVFRVTLTFLRVVGEEEGLVLQFYNILVRKLQSMLEYQLVGRHYFDPKAAVEYPNWKLELWPGFSNSIRQQEADLMLNVDSCWKVLRKDNIFAKMMEIRRQNPDNFMALCDKAIIGMMVVTKYNSRAYKISRIDYGSNPNSTFETRDGPVTYMSYYRTKHKVNIQCEVQPMLVSEPTIRDHRRGQVNDIYLVPELCFQCGLNDELRNNYKLMKDLASSFHMGPAERVQTMESFIRRVMGKEELTAVLKTWNVKILPGPVKVQARTLPPQEIMCGNNQKIRPDEKADWTNDFRFQRMLVAVPLKRWAIVVTGRDSSCVGNLVSTMQRVAGPLGYQISQPEATIRIVDTHTLSYVTGINDAMAQLRGQVDLLFIILATNNSDTYAEVKKRCSIDFGIPSQCLLVKSATSRGLMSICTKVVIQMNAKQGGEPWGVNIPLKSLMILGYDVHHAGAAGGMSVGAMTATVNSNCGRYFSTVARLTEREEVAPAVAGMFEKCLNAYYEKNHAFPARIMMYRDGVGEGHLRHVYEQELQGFKDKIAAMYAEKQFPLPKLSYIVVNKRISTRFFEAAPGRNLYNNPKPGLVVDDVVTRPERYDFFLISKTARQGCVAPTYYNILMDESGLDADKLQLLTYKLCHLYFNWSGTVTVPGPCQNAHKLALLVGTALKRPAHNNLSYLLHFL